MSKTPDWTDLKAIVLDPAGTVLTEEERALFAKHKPAGFILFKRNCESKEQVKKLVADLRAAVGRDDLPVLIDQEGGSVARLRAPAFAEYPSAKELGEAYQADKAKGLAGAEENFRLMGRDLLELGITVDCAPVADVPSPDCHIFLAGSRTYSNDPQEVSVLSAAVCRGLLSAGVSPVIKHIPGHGRGNVDSHHGLPTVTANKAELEKTDFVPFRDLVAGPLHHATWAMAAHVVYSGLGSDQPATMSADIVANVIRGELGFDGVLIADDISMKALSASVADKVRGTLAAGLDLTLLCNASFEDRRAALEACPKVTAEAARRLARAEALRQAQLAPRTAAAPKPAGPKG